MTQISPNLGLELCVVYVNSSIGEVKLHEPIMCPTNFYL